MKDKVEIRFTASEAKTFGELLDNPGNWELTVQTDIIGKAVVSLPNDIAMVVAMAIATARTAGYKEGVEKMKKRYKAINDAAGSWSNPGTTSVPGTRWWQNPVSFNTARPWEDADTPMHWNPEWKLDNPNA